MGPSIDRQQALEPLSIRVYQQISAGYPMEKIRGQFDGHGLDASEVAWVLETGKQRYLGFQLYLRDSNRDSAKWTMLGGLAMFGIVSLLVLAIGWPTAGRQVGIATLGFIGGIGGFLYGAYCWVTAEPLGTRQDLD